MKRMCLCGESTDQQLKLPGPPPVPSWVARTAAHDLCVSVMHDSCPSHTDAPAQSSRMAIVPHTRPASGTQGGRVRMQELHKRRPKPSMMDEFEYVMHGKVYKLDKRGGDGGGVRAEVNVSFGGLLFQLVADAAKLNAFELDSMVYLLVRKAA